MQDNEKCGSAPDRISDNELRSMVKKATQGPWFIGKIDPDRGIWIGGRSEKDGGAVLPYLAIVKTINWPENFIHNGAMIAQAPRLAAEVLELREKLAEIAPALAVMHSEAKAAFDELDLMRKRLHAMHRRAQKAEGRASRIAQSFGAPCMMSRLQAWRSAALM